MTRTSLVPFIIFIMLISYINMSANSKVECDGDKHFSKNMLYTRFLTQCEQVFRACVNERQQSQDESADESETACNLPLRIDNRYR